MTTRIRDLYFKMIEFDSGDPTLIQHFTKVHSYAKLIGEAEHVNPAVLELLEAAALVHDIAIPLCMKKYGSDTGHLQEKEGPSLANEMLSGLDFSETEISRICALVGEHHTYSPIDGIDHQILVESDFIVNSFENNHTMDAKQRILKNIFQTETGKRIYRTMFGLGENSKK